MNPTELMEKVAEVAPEKYAFFKTAAAEIAKGPFAEEVREELDGIMKKAQSALGRFGIGAAKYLGGVGAAAGTAALGGIAMALAGDAYGAAKRGLTKSRNYQAMLEANPDLREAPADRVQRAFSTLHRLNPDFSSDPTVAGSYVRSQAQSEYAQWAPAEMKTLIDAHKNLQDVDRLPTVPNFNPGDNALRRKQTLQQMAHGAEDAAFAGRKRPMEEELLYHNLLKARRGKGLDDAEDILSAAGFPRDKK